MRDFNRQQAQMRLQLRHTVGMNQKIQIGNPLGVQLAVNAGGKQVFLQPR